MQPFHDPIRLRTLHLGAGMIDVLDRHIPLILMPIGTATLLGAAIREDPTQWHFFCLKKRHPLVLEQSGRGQGVLAVIEFRERHLTLSIHEGLLIAAPHALLGADIEGLLRPPISWTFALKFAMRFLVHLRLLPGCQWGFGQNMTLPGHFGLERPEPFVEVC